MAKCGDESAASQFVSTTTSLSQSATAETTTGGPTTASFTSTTAGGTKSAEVEACASGPAACGPPAARRCLPPGQEPPANYYDTGRACDAANGCRCHRLCSSRDCARRGGQCHTPGVTPAGDLKQSGWCSKNNRSWFVHACLRSIRTSAAKLLTIYYLFDVLLFFCCTYSRESCIPELKNHLSLVLSLHCPSSDFL